MEGRQERDEGGEGGQREAELHGKCKGAAGSGGRGVGADGYDERRLGGVRSLQPSDLSSPSQAYSADAKQPFSRPSKNGRLGAVGEVSFSTYPYGEEIVARPTLEAVRAARPRAVVWGRLHNEARGHRELCVDG